MSTGPTTTTYHVYRQDSLVMIERSIATPGEPCERFSVSVADCPNRDGAVVLAEVLGGLGLPDLCKFFYDTPE